MWSSALNVTSWQVQFNFTNENKVMINKKCE